MIVLIIPVPVVKIVGTAVVSVAINHAYNNRHEIKAKAKNKVRKIKLKSQQRKIAKEQAEYKAKREAAVQRAYGQ